MRREGIREETERSLSSLSLPSTMKSVGALMALLLCLCEAGAQGERGELAERDNHVEGANVIHPDVWEELKFVRDLVHSLEETVVAQGHKLKTTEAKLTASEAEVQELRDIVVEQREKLKNVEEEAKEQRDLVTDLRMELAITKHEMEGKTKQNAG